MKLDDPFERFFYEFECMKGTWSVKELRRQIGTNLYFRAGVSKKPELLLERIQQGDISTALSVKEPFALEFLDLDEKLAVDESDLENALMNHLQEFLLELGKGFCFEARQKRILIDDEYFFIDLVFYHRVLHCNVIIELKDEPFSHENLGQLNAYVAYYKENEMNAVNETGIADTSLPDEPAEGLGMVRFEYPAVEADDYYYTITVIENYDTDEVYYTWRDPGTGIAAAAVTPGDYLIHTLVYDKDDNTIGEIVLSDKGWENAVTTEDGEYIIGDGDSLWHLVSIDEGDIYTPETEGLEELIQTIVEGAA